MSRCTLVLFLLLVLAQTTLATAGSLGDERFAPFAGLIGRWQGYAQKPDGSALGLLERTYTYELNGHFIRVESVAMFPPAVPDTHYEIHRDVQYISYDMGADRYVLRGFFVEGFVTRETITFTDDPPTFVFETEAIENGPQGMRTRTTVTLEGEHEIVDSFEIAMPGLEYAPCQSAHLRRVGVPGGE